MTLKILKGINPHKNTPIYIRCLHIFGYSVKITVESPRPDAEAMATAIADRVKGLLTMQADATRLKHQRKPKRRRG